MTLAFVNGKVLDLGAPTCGKCRTPIVAGESVFHSGEMFHMVCWKVPELPARPWPVGQQERE